MTHIFFGSLLQVAALFYTTPHPVGQATFCAFLRSSVRLGAKRMQSFSYASQCTIDVSGLICLSAQLKTHVARFARQWGNVWASQCWWWPRSSPYVISAQRFDRTWTAIMISRTSRANLYTFSHRWLRYIYLNIHHTNQPDVSQYTTHG